MGCMEPKDGDSPWGRHSVCGIYPAFSDQQEPTTVSQPRGLVTAACLILGSGDPEKAVGEEITKPLLLAPGLVQRA